MPRHVVEILAGRQAEHGGRRLRDVILPASQLQSCLQQLLLGLEKAVGALVADQFLVGDFAPFGKRLAPVRMRGVRCVPVADIVSKNRFDASVHGAAATAL